MDATNTESSAPEKVSARRIKSHAFLTSLSEVPCGTQF